ncbi:MAG: hypothetical protein WCG34_11075 [Leptolinea sp.]
MGKTEEYRAAILAQPDLRQYLLDNSNLPGPRGNLELAHVAAAAAPSSLLVEWSNLNAAAAPINTPVEFLTFCGVLGQGRLYLEGDALALERIKKAASDSRWRTREGAATALQIIGKNDMQPLFIFLPVLANGNPLEQRCAVAAICEPALLKEASAAQFALELLDKITHSFSRNPDRKSEGFIALKKGLGYGWSVAVAASLESGKQMMEKWLQFDDKDIRWVMQENLKKNRLIRLEGAWVDKWGK